MAQEAADEAKRAAVVSGEPVEDPAPADADAGPSAEVEEEGSTTQLAVERSAVAEASAADSQAADGEEEEEGRRPAACCMRAPRAHRARRIACTA